MKRSMEALIHTSSCTPRRARAAGEVYTAIESSKASSGSISWPTAPTAVALQDPLAGHVHLEALDFMSKGHMLPTCRRHRLA